MEKIKAALYKHLPSRLNVYKPIINSLVDMGANADPVLVKKVIGLINELKVAL